MTPNVYEFSIPGAPIPKGRARSRIVAKGGASFARHYTPAKTRVAEATLAARVMQFCPPWPLSGPIELSVEFMLPIPPSWSKRKRSAALHGELQHTSRPDLDNLLKLLKDALNGLFWIDDRQIVSVAAAKSYAEVPCTAVRIEEVGAGVA